jgi:hypothetical protein
MHDEPFYKYYPNGIPMAFASTEDLFHLQQARHLSRAMVLLAIEFHGQPGGIGRQDVALLEALAANAEGHIERAIILIEEQNRDELEAMETLHKKGHGFNEAHMALKAARASQKQGQAA